MSTNNLANENRTLGRSKSLTASLSPYYSEDHLLKTKMYLTDQLNPILQGGMDAVPERWVRYLSAMFAAYNSGSILVDFRGWAEIAEMDGPDVLQMEFSPFWTAAMQFLERWTKARLLSSMPAILEGLRKKAEEGQAGAGDVLFRYLGKLQNVPTSATGVTVNLVKNYNISVVSQVKSETPITLDVVK